MRLVALESPLTHRLWPRLRSALADIGVALHLLGLPQWMKHMGAGDIVMVDATDAHRIPPGSPALALLTGAPVPQVARSRDDVLWVAASDGAAAQHRADGPVAQRIIFGATDTSLYFPSERQRRRDADKPVVLHQCPDDLAARVERALGATFVLRATQGAVTQDALNGADIWLSTATEDAVGLPVIDALASGLVVVAPKSGLLWPEWWGDECGARRFDPEAVGEPEVLASCIRDAWASSAALTGRNFARRWLNLAVLGQKWLEAVAAVARQFGIKDASAQAAATGHPWEDKR